MEVLGGVLNNMLGLTIKVRSELNRAEMEVRRRYSGLELSALDVHKILSAEKELAQCAGCTGFPCQKRALCGVRPVIKIEGGLVRVRSEICRHARANQRQRAFALQFAAAKIPAIYLGKSFADYETCAGNEAAVKWARSALETGEGLYVYGEPGTGKTLLAAILAQEFLKRGNGVIFGDVPTLLDELKATFDGGDTRLAELMAALETADVLILDDFGTELPTEWAVERLYKIVNGRYSVGRTTIVTSNYSPKEVAERLNAPKNGVRGVGGSRIVSRLTQLCRIAKISGGDRRINAKKVGGKKDEWNGKGAGRI